MLALLVLGASVSACSNGKNGAEDAKKDKKAAALKACKGVDTEDKENLPSECADAMFVAAVAESKAEDLRNLNQAKILDMGRGVCALASSVTSDPTQSVDFDQMVKANAKNWSLSETSVRSVIEMAEVLCPRDHAALQRVAKNQSPATLTLEASGNAQVQITIEGTDEDKSDEAVTPPWTKSVKVSKANDVILTVFPSAAAGVTTGCRIVVNDIELAKSDGGDGELAVCRVSQGQIRSAVQGIDPAAADQVVPSVPDEGNGEAPAEPESPGEPDAPAEQAPETTQG